MSAFNMIAQVRDDIADTDSIDPALEDDVIISKLNKWIYVWIARMEKRITSMTATQVGLAAVPQGTKSFLMEPTDIFEIVQAYRVPTPDEVFGSPIEITTVERVSRLRSSALAQGIPSKIAFSREMTDVIADIGKWTVHFYPEVGTDPTHVSLLVRRWPALLVNPVDTPDLTELGTLTVCKLAAAECAAILGEPERAGPILQSIPEETQALMGIPRVGYKRAPVKEEVAV